MITESTGKSIWIRTMTTDELPSMTDAEIGQIDRAGVDDRRAGVDDRRDGNDRRAEDDVSTHLEDLLVGELAPLTASAMVDVERLADVELVGQHLRMSGRLPTGHFQRVSDFLNHHDGLIEIRNATVLRRNGDPTKVTMPRVWVSPAEITLIGQVAPAQPSGAPTDVMIQKVARGLIVVTPGHTLTGEVYITAEADLAAFIESPDPPFIPLSDVRTRSLADRRVTSRYPFAMLNRRHIVATSELQPGMAPGRSIL